MDNSDRNSDSEENADISVRVKTEPGEDTIKNYAENTMNELLGLFGYDDKINSSDTKNLNLENYTDGKETGSDVNSDDGENEKEDFKRRRRQRLREKLCGLDANTLSQQHMNLVTVLQQQQQRDRERDDIADSVNPETTPTDPSKCAWCRKPGNKQFSLEGPNGTRVFCSEVCFTQCRRASFKKTRVCDWCKHVRHTVNYVELSEGDTQLQFCTEKCLNQYKMSIFCKETQEHLQKMSDKVQEDSSGDSDNERAILITPDLWMGGENGQKKGVSPGGNRVRNLSNRDKDEVKDLSRASRRRRDTSPMYRTSDSRNECSSSKVSLPRGIKTETSSQHRKGLLTTDRSVSPPPRGVQTPDTSPKPQVTQTAVPPNVFHPALAGMAPWLHPAQLMGAIAPGMMPYPGLSPMMFQPGMLPPQFAGMVPPEVTASAVKDREPGERDKKVVGKKEPQNYTPVNRLLSPTSDRSSVSDTSSYDVTRARSPGHTETRTSSLFPVDFPNLFVRPNFQHPSQIPSQSTSTPVESVGMNHTPTPDAGLPPVTMMVPLPVMVPFPVPVPIPIPLTYQQLKTLFGHDKSTTTTTTTTTTNTTTSSSNDDKFIRANLTDRNREGRSPRPYSARSPMSVTSNSSDYKHNDAAESRADSRNSCPDLSRSFGHSDGRLTDSYKYFKRSRTPDTGRSLDLSQHAKRFRYEFMNSNSVDGAIDLSSTRDNRHFTDDNSSDTGLTADEGDDKSFTRDSNDNVSEQDGTSGSVPKIHIITHDKESPPLNQALPLPPTEKSYSTRRGLILDAPAVPKKSRSPSPQDRRLYVRNVPRDIIEAARRRCMRTRIRTK